MDSALTTIGLPIALAIIMFGLGLDLTLNDFRRVGRHPRAVAVALGCQLILLPAICFGLVVLLDLPALLGIGMLLLAASPGGTSANLFSHLFHGDVALNITLTAINSLIALFTLPLIVGFAIEYYDKGHDVSLPFGEVSRCSRSSSSRWRSACSCATGDRGSRAGWSARCGSVRR